jgi:nicotinate-nucleotide pyrophosphorylase (carboxylating)
MSLAPPDPADVASDVARALAEDIGSGDVSAALIPAGAIAQASILTREDMVLAGLPWADTVFRTLDPEVHVDWRHRDGERVAAGSILCELQGRARALLSGERTALNFLQTLSATATVTSRFVAALAGTGTRVLDTRKTLPGLRRAQKYAVRAGGGVNHRMGLYDAVLIKENHIAAAGGIAQAIAAARAQSPGLMVEIEVESLAEYRQALAARPDRIMLDELPPDELREAIAGRADGIELELSGGVDLDRITAIGQLGVDYVSVGALTKHIRAIDLSMRLKLS